MTSIETVGDRGTASRTVDKNTVPFAPVDYANYAATMFAWGTSWYALKLQVGVVAPEVSLVWRFALAAIIMWGWMMLSGQRMRFPLRDHTRFLLMGILLFSTNFALFYYGSKVLPSGLLSVVFSLTSIINLFLAWMVSGQRISRRVLFAGLLGFGGVALMFWPEIAGSGFDREIFVGIGLCIAGTLCFCLGNQVSASNQTRGLPVFASNGWGMTYGFAFMGLIALVRGHEFIIDPSPHYVIGLIWLAVFSSVLAFASYLTLLGRIGSARAGYLTVMFPLVALAISTLFEGYQWTPHAIVGVGFVLLGNLLVLRT